MSGCVGGVSLIGMSWAFRALNAASFGYLMQSNTNAPKRLAPDEIGYAPEDAEKLLSEDWAVQIIFEWMDKITIIYNRLERKYTAVKLEYDRKLLELRRMEADKDGRFVVAQSAAVIGKQVEYWNAARAVAKQIKGAFDTFGSTKISVDEFSSAMMDEVVNGLVLLLRNEEVVTEVEALLQTMRGIDDSNNNEPPISTWRLDDLDKLGRSVGDAIRVNMRAFQTYTAAGSMAARREVEEPSIEEVMSLMREITIEGRVESLSSGARDLSTPFCPGQSRGEVVQTVNVPEDKED